MVKLNNYFINQAVKNGFKYVDALKEKDELLKFYANANTHVCFVAFSKANGEGVAENGRLFTTQSFTDAIVTEKRYRQFRLEKGMDTK